MNRSPLLAPAALATLALLIATPASAAPPASPDERPNIIVILADDLGYGDVSSYNERLGRIRTPHIDTLARAGMRFTDAHASSGVCSPSRYTLLTGRYHWRARPDGGIVRLWERPRIEPDRLTLPAMLRQAGYATACIGKWHLGWDWPIDPAQHRAFTAAPARDGQVPPAQRAAWNATFAKPIPGGPTARGFDLYYGVDVPNWPPYCFIENDRVVGSPSRFLPPAMVRDHLAKLNGPAVEGWSLEAILPTITDRAVDYIRDASRRRQPYLLYLSLTSPHTPIAVNDRWRGRSRLTPYADFVMETDAMVGRVLDAIAASGQMNRTLVVFTSDNGCATDAGLATMIERGHHPSGPLRGYKTDVWEGGHRMPFIVRWPGVVRAGAVCDQLVHHADLMATLAEIAGRTLPAGVGEDSVSILPLLRGVDEPVRQTAASQSYNGLLSIRRGPWKLIFGRGGGGQTAGGDDQPGQLYHLGDDLGETRNLYSNNPQVVSELTAIMAQQVRDGRSTPGDPQPNDRPVNWNRIK